MAAESQLNPAFSTYYAHRLFMLYQPDDFRMYLGRMAQIGCETAPETSI